MEELQLVISSPEEGRFLQRIEWNRDEFARTVEAVLEEYRDVVFTEDQLADAKKIRARLNAMKKAISDRRIAVKNTVMEPYSVFEAEVKEITDKVDQAIGVIDAQVKGFDEKRKEEKQQKLKSFFLEIAGDIPADFSVVFDQRYLNATMGLDKCLDDIRAKVDGIRSDLKVIADLDDGERAAAKSVYLRNYDLRAALAEAARQKRIRQEEEERRQQVDALKQEAAKPAEKVPEVPKAQAEAPKEQMKKPEEKMYRAAFRIKAKGNDAGSVFLKLEEMGIPSDTMFEMVIYGTKDKLLEFRDWMNENEIEYGKI